MFSLQEQVAVLTSLNTRTEKHGDKHIAAADLKIQSTVENRVLDNFGTNLRTALYCNEESSGQNMALDLEEDFLPNLRYPQVKKLPWQLEIKGCMATIQLNGNKKEIVLSDAKLSRICFYPLEGGSLNIEFTLSDHPTGAEIGKLYEHQNSELKLTLTMPDDHPANDLQEDLEAEFY